MTHVCSFCDVNPAHGRHIIGVIIPGGGVVTPGLLVPDHVGGVVVREGRGHLHDGGGASHRRWADKVLPAERHKSR